MSFPLWPSRFILSGAIRDCPLFFPSSILGTFPPWGFIFRCCIFLSFHTAHGVLTARILEWFVIPFPVDHVLSELFTVTHLSWVALHGMTHSFIELQKPLCCGKAVILLMVKDSENG